jgi:hypothetical protein
MHARLNMHSKRTGCARLCRHHGLGQGLQGAQPGQRQLQKQELRHDAHCQAPGQAREGGVDIDRQQQRRAAEGQSCSII